MKSVRMFSALLLIAALLSVGIAAPDTTALKPEDLAKIEKDWGIKPLTVRLTGADHFLDFRYRVIDPEKAQALLKRKLTVYLIHQPSGTNMSIPITKIGPMRGTAVAPVPDRNYVILFNNVQKLTHSGDPVTIVIGDCRIENMKVDLPAATQ